MNGWLDYYEVHEIYELIREGVVDAAYVKWFYCNSQWDDLV